MGEGEGLNAEMKQQQQPGGQVTRLLTTKTDTLEAGNEKRVRECVCVCVCVGGGRGVTGQGWGGGGRGRGRVCEGE